MTFYKNRVQTLNPRTGRYVKIDLTTGMIIAHKCSKGPYKNVRVWGEEKK